MQLNFIKQLKQFGVSKQDKILLALSGGVDSMVLCDLLIKHNLNFSIAHCNFCLRGEDSDVDEHFIQSFAKSKKIKFFIKRFNTLDYAKSNRVSIQMAARQLRYDWFQFLKEEHKFNYIATAHHKDDSVETLLINLIRGTGISGLHGIKNTSCTIRPISFFSKQDVIDYAKNNGVIYREDVTNKGDKYIRNKIRNKIIPLMQEINPNVIEAISKTITHISGVEHIYNEFIQLKKKELIKDNNGEFIININEILNEPAPKQLLYEIISEFGFQDVNSVFQSLNSSSGKEFFSSDFYMIKDRSHLIITKHVTKNTIFINEKTTQIDTPLMSFHTKLNDGLCKDTMLNLNHICVNHDKLDFPLIIRPWEEGDVFMPLGMSNFKKISDYFIDNKFSLIEKKKARLLISNKNIVCIFGKNSNRIDERFKLVEDSKKAYIVTLH